MEETKKKQSELKIKKTAYVAVVLLSAVFFLYAVILNVFQGTVWDRGVFAIGGTLFPAVMIGLIRQLPSGLFRELRVSEQMRKDACQIGCFALVCLSTLYYYNSGSEYGHSVALKVISGAFGMAMLAMFSQKQRSDPGMGFVECLIFLLWSVMGWRMNPTMHDRVLITTTGIMALIYADLLYIMILQALNKNIRTRLSRYGVLVLVFLAGIVILRNTRTWPFAVTIPFGCLYLYPYKDGEENRLLKNFCYGSILAFWLMAGSGFLFRPYYSFEFTRYPSWFASVASASLFWMLVLASTLAAFLARWDAKGIRGCLFELATFGAVGAYLIMGMARTSLLGVAAFCVMTFVLVEKYKYRDSLRKMGKKLLLFFLSLLVMLPVIYTLTRCVPAMVKRPIWVTRSEWFSDRITKEDPISSGKYMNVPQFAESLLEKMLGIDINLSSMAGARTGPDADLDDLERISDAGNVVGYRVGEDGQTYAIKDYTFENDSEEGSANGRLDIWKLYLQHMNLFGHDSMIIQDSELVLYHAHNTFLQVAFDHGVPMGLLFVILTAGGIVTGIRYYRNCHKEESFAAYPVMVVIAFAISGMTEWVFHPSIPIGFAYLLVLTPLIRRNL